VAGNQRPVLSALAILSFAWAQVHAHLKLCYKTFALRFTSHGSTKNTKRERKRKKKKKKNIKLLATRRGYNCSQILKRLKFHHPYPILFNPNYNISLTSSKLMFLSSHTLFSTLFILLLLYQSL